jgi:hypothetical protein
MTQWQDLSEEDKLKVIGGIVMVVSMLVFSFVFFQVFLISALPLGVSPFSAMRMILLMMYVVVVIPTALATGGTVVYLRRRFSEMLNALIILLVVGGYLLMVTLLLTISGVFLSGLPIEVAIIVMTLTLFVPAVITAQLMRAKKNTKYLKWAFK